MSRSFWLALTCSCHELAPEPVAVLLLEFNHEVFAERLRHKDRDVGTESPPGLHGMPELPDLIQDGQPHGLTLEDHLNWAEVTESTGTR